jgi:hypothetical protein
MQQALKAFKDYGISAALCFGIVYLNTRVNTLDQRLDDCYTDRIDEIKQFATTGTDAHERTFIAAIIPDKIRIRRDGK